MGVKGEIMFLLYNIIGWSINELGLADEFVRFVIDIEPIVLQIAQWYSTNILPIIQGLIG